MVKDQTKSLKTETCQLRLKASRDALEVIQGKWRVPIIISLTFGNKRFGEIKREISDISPKMLSQELRILEENQIIQRHVYDSKPVMVEYELTALGRSMKKMLDELLTWGLHFRKQILNKQD
ncbi:MAG: putative HTH-type transcriptional regulator YtcD [Bacteroidota bacterium]|jgi:DNA-binding HxlR family transcriptional regulator